MASTEKSVPEAQPVEHPGQTNDVTLMEAAMIAESAENMQYSPWTFSMIRLYGCLLIGYLCACMNGYDGSVMGGINAMDSYLQYFNMVSASSSTGIVFAIYNIGMICAVPFVGPVNDYWGRRAGMFTGAAIVIIGTVITASAINTGMFMGGRFVLGMGVSFCNVSGPVYVGELAHPRWRGLLCGLYNCFWFIGAIVASWVVYAVQYQPSGWRIPLYCQLISSALIVVCVWFIPDSPRWLISQGRVDSERAVLARYHGEGDPEHPLVKLQMAEMEFQISTEGSDKKWWDYSDLIKTHSNRRRLLAAMTMACFGQLSGNSVTSYYFPVALQTAGITSQQKKLLLNGINAPLCFIAAIAGSFFTDKFGRRPLLMGTLMGCIMCFAILTPASKIAAENPTNLAAGNTTIAFIYLFAVIFAFAWTPLAPISGPAFQNMKHYFYIVFIGWDVFEIIIIYLFWPETKGRTLEELEEVFNAPNPVKKSVQPKDVQSVLNTLHIESKAEGI